MTPYYLQAETEADMWAALTEMGFVSEHDGERYINVEHGSNALAARTRNN